MLREIVKQIKELFPKAKFYEANAVVQNGIYLVFESVSFENRTNERFANYVFKLLLAANSLNKDSSSVLSKCDELLAIAFANKANCIQGISSKLNVKSVDRVQVREGLFCYEITLFLECRL